MVNVTEETMGKFKTKTSIKGAASAVIYLVCLMFLYDANAEETASTTDQIIRLEEIIVTARRKEEDLQKTPVAVTAMTSADIQDRNISNLSEIQGLAPNLSISNTAAFSGSTSTAVVFLRGFGQTDFTLTTEPGVGVYIDGIYAGRSLGALLDLGDLQRLEVLRGPQGTLFGKNAIGGALNVTTNRPVLGETSGMLEATVGRYNRTDVRGIINAPLGEKAAVRIVGATLNRNGYAERIFAGDRLGGRNTVAGKVSLLFEPSSSLEIFLSADYTKTDGESAATTLTGLADGVFIAPGDTVPLSRSGALDAIQSTLPAGTLPITFANFATNDPFKSGGVGANFVNDEIWGISGSLKWFLNENLTVKSLTAYREVDSSFGRDAYNLPFANTTGTVDEYQQQQFTQEVQLQGQSFDSRLEWVMGVFYLGEKGRNENRLPFNALILPPFTGVNPAINETVTLLSGGKVDNTSLAFFAQGTYELTDALSITAGIRYSSEKKKFDTRGFQFIVESGLLLAPQKVFKEDYTDWSPRLSAEYQWSSEIMTYASFSSGYKGGGFIQRVFPGALLDFLTPGNPFTIESYGPETADVFEVGSKTEFFDNRLRVNIAAFFTQYNDVQIVVREGFTPLTRNAGEVEIKGFEVEFEALVSERLLLSGTVGYLNAEFVKVDPDANEVTLDSKLPYTSDWTIGLSTAYTIFERGDQNLKIRADYNFRSAYFTQAANEPITKQGAFSLVSVHAIYSVNDTLSIQAGVTNVFGEEYLAGASSALGTLGFAEGNFAPPSQWYLTVRKNF